MIIGSHVSFNKEQLYGATKQAISYGANTFMFYTGAPQNTRRSNIDDSLTSEAKKLMAQNNIDINHVICHAPYIINLANKENTSAWHFSISFMQNEIKRIEQMNVKYIVLHPGNYLKIPLDIALNNISEAVNKILEVTDTVTILLETMAGKGTECGRSTNEIKQIISKVEKQQLIGVCLDTCHLNDSGISIPDFNTYLDEFDSIIGIEKIKCVHINDSKNNLGEHKDRHANLGYGTIGFDNLINVIYNERLKNVPKILETPWIGEYPPYKIEIDMIKNKRFNPNLELELKSLYSMEPNL